ncbi:FCS-Like Zinc finger 11-like [Punica granatum]|uniref:FCS-Like Zinc finger 11-like n=1 Tax=Punica granatum TaxID=22663 RepID=A0A6P8BQS1_PUNGR|nr:FCS-Like Zinc finger 11-like [Punica granatum]
MLMKRTRSVHKEVGETAMSDCSSESNTESQTGGNSHKSNSFFNVASLFRGLNPKNASYNDSAKSPKSPLDEGFLRSPGSTLQDARQKSWNSSKVGLSIVDSLDADDGKNEFARDRIILSSDSKGICFGPTMRHEPPKSYTDISSSEAAKPPPRNSSFPYTRTKSPLHKGSSDVVFEIGGGPVDSDSSAGKSQSCSMDSCVMVNHHLTQGSPKSSNLSCPTVASKDGFVGSLSANGIELSEDYTCVILHGPNPQTTHIYGDCILECHPSDELLSEFVRKFEEDMRVSSKAPASYPIINSLSSCYSCKKPLEEGKDIYIYRGEKAFCSVECRWNEISFDEETKDTAHGSGDKGGILKRGSLTIAK